MNSTNLKCILIYSLDKNYILSLLYNLRKDNFEVDSVSNKSEFNEVLKSNKFDLIIFEINDNSDFNHYFQLKGEASTKNIPVILVTNNAVDYDNQSKIESNGDEIISKICDYKELFDKINILLKRSEIYEMFLSKSDTNTIQQTKTKILLVDDDPNMIKLFKFTLEKAGYECIAFNSPIKALESAKSYIPDLIISDIMMPEMDGFEFRKQILKQTFVKNIPFLFLTAKGNEDDILKGYELEITDYVLKTAGPKVVLAKVNAIVSSLNKQKSRAISELRSAASNVAVKVIPESAPKFDKYDIKHWHQTYQGIPGGDLIDYFKIDEKNLILILGDVMGKKWGAWHFALAYAGYIRSTIRAVIESSKDFSPSKILSSVNKMIYRDVKVSEVFISLSIVHLDNKNNLIKYCGAGDNPLLYVNQNGNLMKVKSDGLLLGFSEDSVYNDISLSIRKDEKIIMFTDGLIESRNKEGEQFGTSELKKSIFRNFREFNIIDRLKNDFISFTSNQFEDDVSLIVVQRTSD
jgi:sigma-B regulation protein RsbU (phosphoserine phosphatase)